MKLRAILAIFGAALFISSPFVLAQVDSVIGQFTNSISETFVNGMSGDGRFVVFESRGNLATTNPRNEDGNVEVFLFDYAQRQIFQITNTKSVVIDPNRDPLLLNIRVEIVNRRPVISNDGRWISFSSNATGSVVISSPPPLPTPDGTNPGNFDGNSYNTQTLPPCTLPTPVPTPTPTATPTPTGSPTPAPTPFNNPLDCDGNLEMWMYEIPAYAPADLTTGEEIPFVDLGLGSFTQVTNSWASRLPQRATGIAGAFVADDNHDASIDDDGSVIAFVSTRNLVPPGNPVEEANDEIFTFVRTGGGGDSCTTSGSGSICQITLTPSGDIFDPIYNKHPTISGLGNRVVFSSTGDNPVIGMTGGNNPSTSRNEEIFVAGLTAGGARDGVNRQITTTTPLNPGDPVNILETGRRMSRDGRYIAFDSYADLANEHSGTNQTTFATFIYDYDAVASPPAPLMPFTRVLPRSDADAEALGGDVSRYPGFTDYDVNGVPSTFVLETRMNILPNGTMPTNEADGLNPTDGRPIQIYRATMPPETADFTRLTKLPLPTAFLASAQPFPSNSASRMAFTLALTEFGTGNPDLFNEGFYLYEPISNNESPASFNLATGASRMLVSGSPVPTPSPTATPSPTPTPTPTPTPSPTPTPTGTPTPVPTPTPQTPPAVQGVSPGMLAVLTLTPRSVQPIVARTGVGSLSRSFTLPIELSGVTVTINGAACGIKSVARLVNRYEIIFVVPTGLASATPTVYPIVANVNGTVSRSNITIVPYRPDIFSSLSFPGPGGRALVTNVTNRVHTTEPFTARTIRIRGGVFTDSVLRVRVTGVQGGLGGLGSDSNIKIEVGGIEIIQGRVVSNAVLVEPGVYTIDFLLPPGIAGAGDVPIIVTLTDENGVKFSSRLDDTAARLFIL